MINLMKSEKIVCLILCMLTVLSVGVSQAQNANEIVRQADEKFRGDTRKATSTMQIIRPSWQREMSMKVWSKGNQYALILITAPAREEGNAFLKRGKEIWHWIPNVSRMVKLPPSMMSQSWMGSDFSNNDLVRESSIVVDYNHELAGTETVEGRECYKIRMEPKPDAPIVYDHVIMWISKDEYLQLKTEFYGENDKLVNTMIMSDIQEMDGRQIPTHMEMIDETKQDHKTVMDYQSIKFNMEIPDGFFSQQNMKRAERLK